LTVQQPLPAELVPPPDTGIKVPAPLAALWFLPEGAAGWLLLSALVALVLILWVSEQGRRWAGAHRLLSLARAGLALLAVIAAVGIGSRAVVEAANRPIQSAVSPIPATAASIERGRLIYLANCSSCHGITGSGDGPQAAGMLPAPGAIGSTVASLTDGALHYLVTTGVAGTKMPSFATSLSEIDRWDLVNYLRASLQPDR
jgi:mono/diheme cytochrome c family protein